MRRIAMLAAALMLFVGCRSGCGTDTKPQPSTDTKPYPHAAKMDSAATALTSAQIAWIDDPSPAARKALETAVLAYRKVDLAGSPASQGDSAAVDAWFDQVQAAHAAADAARSHEEQDSAIDTLRALAKKPAPEAMAAPDAARLRHDLYGRCARMLFELDRFEDAAVVANQGLFISAPDPLRVQLLILLAEGRRGSGDASGGDAALALARKALALPPKSAP